MKAVTKTTRQLKAEQTKLQIFNAAMRLLETTEFDSITVRDIVREANVSVGSFYNSYRSKLDVFYETYQIADNYFDFVVSPKLTQPTSRERILYFFKEYASYNSDLTLFALTKVLYNANNSCFHRNSDHGMVPILIKLIQQAKESGEFSTVYSAEETANFFMICVRGIVYDWCTCNGNYNLKERIEEYVLHLLRSFQGNNALTIEK